MADRRQDVPRSLSKLKERIEQPGIYALMVAIFLCPAFLLVLGGLTKSA